MRYQGSKKRIASDIVDIIHANLGNRTYVEPFMGGCNILKHIVADRKIGADGNRYVAHMWQELKNGTLTIPEYISKDYYLNVRESYKANEGKYSDGKIALVGILGSYGGKMFNGYANFNPNKNEDHVREALNGLRKDWSEFKCRSNTEFYYSDYRDLNIPHNSFIYCDPPYQDTLGYNGTAHFDSELFWNWCRSQEKKGNFVLVSEYQAPSDFVCVWQKEIRCGMNSQQGIKQDVRIEKLFVHKSRLIKMNDGFKSKR